MLAAGMELSFVPVLVVYVVVGVQTSSLSRSVRLRHELRDPRRPSDLNPLSIPPPLPLLALSCRCPFLFAGIPALAPLPRPRRRQQQPQQQEPRRRQSSPQATRRGA